MVGELDLISSGVDLTADIVIMGHHEWGFSGQHQFLAATGARVLISSGASYPGYEMPKPGWTAHMEDEGYQLFNQWETGAVMMDFSENEVLIQSYLDDEKRVVLQR
jgi:beta-lactamase superfamily II metal-dependent hydrolase